MSIFLSLFLLSVNNTSFSQFRPSNLDSYNFNLLPPIGKLSGPNGLDSVIRYDFKVKLRDGVILDCLKYIPTGVPVPSGGFPTVIMCHGYGDNKETLAKFCHDQGQYGYYTCTYSMRGQGLSGGLSNLISQIEMKDLLEFIASVKKDSVNGSNPNNILIMGGSQGGLIPFMAACYGAPVKTIISALAPPNFASSWIENGSIKMTFLWTVSYTPDTARYNSTVSRFAPWVYANNKAKWDSLAYWLPIGRDFMSGISNSKVPMIIEGSWQDKFFNADGIIQATGLLQAPFRMYLGAVIGHGGDNSPTENTWHMQFFNDWFYYWLFGINNGTLDAPKYQLASTVAPFQNNAWTFVHDSSRIPIPQMTSMVRYYFLPNRTLSASRPNVNKILTFNNKVSAYLSMQEAVNEEFTGSVFKSKFKKDSIIFETAPFAGPTEILGTPRIGLRYASTANTFCQYNFQMYEVDPNGNANLITRGNFTDRKYKKGAIKNITFKAQAHSHIFSAGYKIRIVVTNLDWCKNDAWFMGTNPFVLPVLNSGTNAIFCDGSTYIDLPVIQTAGSVIASLNSDNSTPNTFFLMQNYPNPFNPTTKIEYSLASPGKVEIKIYDLLGREAASLVNAIEGEGLHSIQFNAANLASGIYFYKINVVTSKGSFTDVKKMIVVK